MKKCGQINIFYSILFYPNRIRFQNIDPKGTQSKIGRKKLDRLTKSHRFNTELSLCAIFQYIPYCTVVITF